MATYYRWAKSTVIYAIRNGMTTSGFDFSSISYTTNYSFDESTGLINKVGETTVVRWSKGKTFTIPENAVIMPHAWQSESSWWIASSPVTMKCTGSSDSPDIMVQLGEVMFQSSYATRGDFIDYVYSTNASQYPTDGQSGSSWYDQRTTVTSPTAPSGLTTPNLITTPSITVSWSAATSNTDYPVNLYELSYSTNGGSSWTVVGTTASTSMEVDIPAVATSILFRVRARDSNGQWGSYSTSSTAIPVYLAPTLTVPQMLMQGQQATINWTAIEGADSYTLQRKANTDTDWTQVYSGANTTFSETAGTWTTVQYRVQAVFDGTPGGWATSAEIPVVSASALVISGQDGDLGTLVNDVPYTISTDTGNQITATVRVNGSLLFSGTVVSGAAMAIPVLDLPTGDGTIVIEASVMSGSSMVTAMRTWTYDKTISGFANHGSTAKLQKDGKYIWPDTIAEAVRMQGGITLDRFIASTVITLTTSGWDQSGGIYKQTVDCPVVWPYAPIIVIDPDLNGEDQDADDSILEAWQSGPGAKGMKQGDGTITFFSASQPTMNIPVRVGVI